MMDKKETENAQNVGHCKAFIQYTSWLHGKVLPVCCIFIP